jgi:iron complex outermembrane recepter protein
VTTKRWVCWLTGPTVFLFFSFSPVPLFSQRQTGSNLAQASLEDLLNIQVTSVSKKEQKLSRTASAVFVITQEDIRRSGATNTPDLLRMVPGLDVAEINGSTWAISARGFNAQFSNKLLVMVDGRIVYTPNFAGVYWDTVDVPLEDIDRIEVIRGPGGTIWGANAVNGVISIFTKKAGETRGGLVEAGSGYLQRGFGTVQYGGNLHGETDYRVFTKDFDQSHLLDLNGASGADGWHMFRSGFRTDSTLSSKDGLMVEGDIYDGSEGEMGFYLPSVTSPTIVPLAEQIGMWGGSLDSAWSHAFSARSDGMLQVTFNRYKRNDPLEPEKRTTADLNYQHHINWRRHDIVWGLGYRFTTDRIGGSLTVSYDPPSKDLQLFSSFLQDEIALQPDRLYLTLGTKLEHNDYTGFELMPNVRATWMPSTHHMFWLAVSRALRAPSRNDTNLIVNLGSVPGPDSTPILLRFTTNPQFHDEHLLAYEIGYRSAVSNRLSLDVAAYYNQYDDVQTTEPSTPFFEATPLPAHIVQPFSYQNAMNGETHGIEVAANWRVTNRWKVSPGYAVQGIEMSTDPASQDRVTPLFVEHATPRHSAQLRSHYDLSRTIVWDTALYFVDRLSNQGPTDDVVIPAYTRLDIGVTWKPGERFAVSLFGQNLLQDQHLEFEDIFGSMQSSQMKRSGVAKFTWTF